MQRSGITLEVHMITTPGRLTCILTTDRRLYQTHPNKTCWPQILPSIWEPLQGLPTSSRVVCHVYRCSTEQWRRLISTALRNASCPRIRFQENTPVCPNCQKLCWCGKKMLQQMGQMTSASSV
ncbi:hypothetical protein NP493_1225g02056 [Ridgeia piscesae]|uniref:Uncharacterized protein n=1 Tax=Ridgeia piscesae TaxID=27915 RepID=A0AAD9KD01_RIDPI|nr:hypothetical protein NP493_1225g02056 [Ridgeia piscesae]